MKPQFYDRFLDDIGDMIFVYGSNLSGVHGAGCALLARKRYGAIYGNPIGRQGQSFAIPTKDYHIQKMKLETIEAYVEIFLKYVKDNPTLRFYVTPLGTKLAGHSHADIAPMFKNMEGIDRCMFFKEWEPYL